MVMNKGLQKHVIRKKFRKQGVNDLDLESLIDAELSLPENVQNLQEQGYLAKKKDRFNSREVMDRVVNTQIRQAINHLEDLEGYSKQQAETDSGIDAHTVFEPPLTEEEFNAWLSNPSEFDIKGVDTEEDLLVTKLDFSLS